MKSIKKIFAGLLMATAAFWFFGCSDSEEDAELETEIIADGNDQSTSRKITMKADSTGSEGHEVFIVYTTDGNEPNFTFDSNAYNADKNAGNITTLTKDNILTYVDYGTANLYEEPFTISSTTDFNAKAFYIIPEDTSKPFKFGPNSKKTITVALKDTVDTSKDSDSNKTGTLNFKLATSGNTNSIHYYDTSATTFKYKETPSCYYQIQFSWKNNNGGNWYLYIRQLGSSTIITSDAGTKFVAKGTFEGSALNAKNPVAGDLTLKYVDKDNNSKTLGTVSVTAGAESSFDLTVSESGETSIQAAIDANDQK